MLLFIDYITFSLQINKMNELPINGHVGRSPPPGLRRWNPRDFGGGPKPHWLASESGSQKSLQFLHT